MNTPTLDAVRSILTRQFKVPEELAVAGAPLRSLGLDSLSLMEFVFAVEDHFGLRIPEEDLDPRQASLTLSDLCAALDAARAPVQAQAQAAVAR